MRDIPLIYPDWPAPANVKAVATTRQGGVSEGRFASLNLGFHVEDDPQKVYENRRLLAERLMLPGPPRWVRQVHSNGVVRAETVAGLTVADASYTERRHIVCAVMTADCLPILLCNTQGTRVAAIHAGWRGLVAGVIAATVQAISAENDAWMAWLGPAISGAVYEVGEEVYAALVAEGDHSRAFTPTRPHHYRLDLVAVARRQLAAVGIDAVYGGTWCTFSDAERFYSYRRDQSGGRQASLIWLT